MNYYRPPLVPAIPAVLSPVPVKWSPVPVVTTSMSKSAQAAPVGYGQMSVMLQSLPASYGLPVAKAIKIAILSGIVFVFARSRS
ncbi:hypothetical protein Tco_0430742, partial [Tanacetum coccineum]